MGLDVNARWEAVLASAAELEPDAYFFTGDFCAHDPEASVYDHLYPRLQALRTPYYIIPGNHDDRALMRRSFPLIPGADQEPIYGLVELGGHSFAFLDSSRGTVEDPQLDWLSATLVERPDTAVVIHHPPTPMGIRFMDTQHPLRETDRLLDILTRDGHRRRVFCGHYHTSRTVSHANLDIFLCPPTSFFIHPTVPEFKMEDRLPGYFLLEWTLAGDFRCSQYATSVRTKELQS